jgi:GNAT superfamily N-acetyltransferase
MGVALTTRRRGWCGTLVDHARIGWIALVTFAIRRYVADDRPAVRSLHDVALHAVDAHGGRGPWDDDLDHIPAVYLAPGGEFLVGCWDGRLVAMGGLQRVDDSTAQIKRMRVHPEFWRRGFARLLLAELEMRARRLGVTTVRLDTTDRQTAAEALYRADGYREVGRHDVGRFRAIDFEKTLGASGQP